MGERVLVGALVTLAAVGGAGLALAVAGQHRTWLTLLLGAAAAAGLLVVWDLRRPSDPTGRCPPTWAWAVALLLAAASVVGNGARAQEHVVMDRDPAVYLNAAQWLRVEGRLDIALDDPAAASDDRLTTRSPGIVGDGDEASFQGLHLLAVYVATAGDLFGTGAMARVPAVLSGLVLLAVFALATRIARPLPALAATALLGLLLPFAWAARDLYSEWPLALLVLGGAWLLDAALASGSDRRALVAGVVVGLALPTRIDAVTAAVGLAPVLALWARHHRRSPRQAVAAARSWGHGRGRLVATFAAGLAPGAALAAVDGFARSSRYIVDHGAELAGQALAASVIVALCAATVGLWPARANGFLSPSRRRVAGLAAAGGVVALGLFLAVLRSRLGPSGGLPDSEAIRRLQLREGIEVAPGRTYADRSLHWLSWYLGWPALVAAVLALAWWAAGLVRGGLRRSERLVLCLVLPSAVLYLARPSIYPDHPWAMRRFLPVVLPGLCLLLAAAVDRCWGLARRDGLPRSAAWSLRGLAVAAAVAPLVHAAAVLWPLRDVREHGGQLALVESVCEALPPDAAVLVVPDRRGGTSPSGWAVPIRTFCRVPAAAVRSRAIFDEADVRALAHRWARRGRQLWLVGAADDALEDRGASVVHRVVRRDDAVLSASISRRPAQVRTGGRRLVVGPVEGTGADASPPAGEGRAGAGASGAGEP